MLAPVMYRESSEARKAQTSATSAGGQREDKKEGQVSVVKSLETERVRHTRRPDPGHIPSP